MVSFVEKGVDFKNVYDHFSGILRADLVRIWLEVWTLDLQVCKERYFCLILHSYIKHLKGISGEWVLCKADCREFGCQRQRQSELCKWWAELWWVWWGRGTTPGRPVGEPAPYVTTPRLSQGRSSLCFPEAFLVFPKNYRDLTVDVNIGKVSVKCKETKSIRKKLRSNIRR